MMYIDALDAYLKADANKKKERNEAFTKALERILYKHPDDLEARALLALQLWKNRDAGIPITSFLAVDALIDQVFLKNPMHPAHHYRIHLWDIERADNALASAALCGQSSPGIAHMWHMQIPSGPGLGVELDRDKLARAHETYQKCGMKNRNDADTMRLVEPGWERTTL